MSLSYVLMHFIPYIGAFLFVVFHTEERCGEVVRPQRDPLCAACGLL